jgi:hypothetical protein
MRAAIILLICFCLSGCANPKTIDGYTYKTYCLINTDDRNEDIEYQFSLGSLIAAIVLSETIVVPIYVAGWNCMEPIGKRDPSRPRGTYAK